MSELKEQVREVVVIAALAGIALGVFCAAPMVVAQGSRKDDIVFNAQGRPMAGATVRVCTSAATGQPCAPLALIYSDPGLTQALANPTTTDGLGNYNFYAAPGKYEIEISGPNITTKQLPNVILPSDPTSPTFTTVTTTSGISAFSLSLAGNLTVSGSTAVTGALTVGGAQVPSTASDNQWTSSQHFKGPIPWADVTAFGAREVIFNAAPQSTATCTQNSANVTIAAATSFQNGDGVTVYGCGGATGMSTPGAPTVTPSLATGGTALGGGSTGNGITVASGTGSSTYSYEIIARDKFGGYTAPSTATTITNGLSSLGLTNCAISTLSRSNDSITVNFPSSCAGAVNGAMVHITGTSAGDFVGWFSVNSHSGSTQVTFNSTSLDTRGNGLYASDVTSATGGNAAFYLSNHLIWSAVTGAWEYYVCAERPGDSSYKLIGQTRPSANSWIEAQFDDYGSPYMDNQTYPSYITNSLCNGGSASPDPLTSTIVSGAGTTSLVLANAAASNSSGKAIVFDDAPGILAAASSISFGGSTSTGTLFFPPALNKTTARDFLINSYLTLPSNISVRQLANIYLNETLELPGNINWDGFSSQNGGFSFTMGGNAVINEVNASPGLYISGDKMHTTNTQIQSLGNNGGVLIVYNAPVGSYWSASHLMFQTNGGASTDYLGMALVSEAQGGADTEIHFDHNTFLVGPGQTKDGSWTPMIYFPPIQNGSGGLLGNEYNIFSCADCTYNRRGIEEELAAGNGGQWEFINGHRQGGITPFLLLGNSVGGSNAYVHIDNLLLDTESVSTVAATFPNSGFVAPSIDATMLLDGSADSGSGQIPPPFTGRAPQHARLIASTTGKMPNMSGFGIENNALPMVNVQALPQAEIGPNGYVYWPIAPPTNLSGTAAAGGSLANKTWQAAVTAVGADGRESAPTPLSAGVATSGGNNEINFTWNASTGAVSYDFYQCGNVTACGTNTATAQVTTGITGTSYTYATEVNGGGPPQKGTTGLTAANSSGMFAPKFECAEGSAPAGLVNADLLYCDSTAHQWKKIENNGATFVVAGTLSGTTGSIGGSALTPGQCASGTVSIANSTTSMTVSVSPNTYPGDGFIPWGYVSANGTVTVKVCAQAAGTPASSTYNVRVIQ